MATYKTTGTCSRRITFSIENNIITSCSFERGCVGSLQAISRLVTGKPAREVIRLLEGIQCQNGTSCPDQLAKALREHLGTAE